MTIQISHPLPTQAKKYLSESQKEQLASHFSGTTPRNCEVRLYLKETFEINVSLREIEAQRRSWEMPVVPLIAGTRLKHLDRLISKGEFEYEGVARSVVMEMVRDVATCSNERLLTKICASPRLLEYAQKRIFPLDIAKRLMFKAANKPEHAELIRALPKGHAPLMFALNESHTSIAEYLINRRNLEGMKALVAAGYTPDRLLTNKYSLAAFTIHTGRLDIFSAFLDEPNWNVNVRSGVLQDSLAMMLIRNKEIPGLKKLLQSPDFDVNAANTRGETPLLRAAKMGYEKGVQVLLECNTILVNKRDADGHTPLMRATLKHRASVFQVLIGDARVNVNAIDKLGRNVLMHLAKDLKGTRYLAKVLSKEALSFTAKDSEGNTAFHIAAQSGNLSALKLLYPFYADKINERNGKNLTALHLACSHGKKDVVQFLLSKEGIDVRVVDDCLNLPIHYAAINNLDNSVIKMMEMSPGIINKINLDGHTALSLATRKGFVSLVRKLLENPQVETIVDGVNALDYALEKRHEAVVMVYIELNRANIGRQNPVTKNTLLLSAAQQGLSEVVEHLMERDDVDLIVRNYIDLAVWQMSASRGYFELSRKIFNHPKLDVNQKYSDSTRPLFLEAICNPEPNIELETEYLLDPRIDWSLHDRVMCEIVLPEYLHPMLDEVLWLHQNRQILDDRALFQGLKDGKKKVATCALFRKEPDMMYKAIKRGFPELLELSLSGVDMGKLLTPSALESYPTPHLPVSYKDLLVPIEGQVVQLYGAISLCTNIEKRNPIVAFPSKESQPEAFERAYQSVERCVTLIAIAVKELKEQYLDFKSKGDNAKATDRLEHIQKIYERISEIGPRCGTRYSQDLDSLLYNQIYRIDGIDCVLLWKAEKSNRALVSGGDSIMDCRLDLGQFMVDEKKNKIEILFHKTRNGRDNAHTRTTFLELIKEIASLPEDATHQDPFLEHYSFSKQELRTKVLTEWDCGEFITSAMPRIKASGGDKNPYISVLSNYAQQHKLVRTALLSDVFSYDEETYEYKEITRPYAILLFRLIGVLF